MRNTAAEPGFEIKAGQLRLHGRLDAAAAALLWPQAVGAKGVERIDLSGVELLDTTGAVLVLEAAAAAGDARIEGATPRVAAVLQRARAALAAPGPPAPPRRLSPLAALGRWGIGVVKKAGQATAFLGEATVATLALLRHPGRLRAADLLRQFDEVGTRAFPLTILLGTLIGVILAFQSSIPMRKFGADIFIPQLVGISLIRELGPLMAAVILSGRTGSAFAAELGTMTVNEEVDAMRIMGVEPMAMLVVPRLIAATLVMPVLALVMNLSGLIGMGVVMGTLGYPPALVINQLAQSLSLQDLAGGLFKAAVFGLSIGLIGCRAGLSAGRGPRAVGDAATAAVVGGIVSIVVLDGIFAVLFYRLGI